MKEIKFIRRPPSQRYQFRFWTTPELHNSFMSACEKQSLVAQDVMNEFLIFFIDGSNQGTLNILDKIPHPSVAKFVEKLPTVEARNKENI